MATTTKKGSRNTKAKPRRAVVKSSPPKRAQTIAELRQELEARIPTYTLIKLADWPARRWKCHYRLLMGTAMHARNFSGAVIDGGVRDVAYLNKIGFPVYALGIVPSTSVHHYRFAGSNIPLKCDGVEVKPMDILVADADGVVVVPRASAAEVLALAQKMDFNEHSMYAYIEKLKSITEAVKKFGRL